MKRRDKILWLVALVSFSISIPFVPPLKTSTYRFIQRLPYGEEFRWGPVHFVTPDGFFEIPKGSIAYYGEYSEPFPLEDIVEFDIDAEGDCKDDFKRICKQLEQYCVRPDWSCDPQPWADGALVFQFAQFRPDLPGDWRADFCIPDLPFRITYTGHFANFDKFKPMIQTALRQMQESNSAFEPGSFNLDPDLADSANRRIRKISDDLIGMRCSDK